MLHEKYVEEIEGDMEEIFLEQTERQGLRQAKLLYAREVLKLLRPVLMKKIGGTRQVNHFIMFNNYFKVSLRGLMKNPVNSFINVFGLSAAIGICVFAYAFARWTFSTDQFHEHKNEVYLATFFADRDGTEQQYGTTPRPLGEMLREDFAQVHNMCRVEDRSVIVKQDDQIFHERIRFTDAEFLEMLTFPLKWGTAASLKDVNSLILSENMSIKYFGDENPVGQTMMLIFNKDASKPFKVTGVAKEFPKARTISFDFLINFENLRTADATYDFDEWNAFVNATFVQVKNPADLASIQAGMEKYRQLQNRVASEDWEISSFAFEPLATLHKNSEYIRDDISRSSKDNYTSIVFMVVIAIFLLALACFNYINISIASAARRLKEIGVRKSIGANRKIVVVQFLSENLVITFFALVIGLGLGIFFFIPGFESLWNFDMGFSLADGTLWVFLPVILIITSVASGIYPSLYISRFQVVNIMRGSVKFGQKNPLTKILLGFELVMACVFITCSVLFTQNSTYLSQRSWGYSPKEVVYAHVPDEAAYEKLSARMQQHPDVLSISGSVHQLGKNNATSILHVAGREYEVDELSVDARYLETMGLQMKEGRPFNNDEGSDRQLVMINEQFAKQLAWDEPLGRTFKIDTVQYEIIGVIKDFHHFSFSKRVRPIIFKKARPEDFRYLSVKVREDEKERTYRALQQNWSVVFPEIPFDGGYQEDVWGFYYQQIEIYGIVWKVFAFMAVTLAVLGLYGLIKLNVEGRTKEFSIRKVLGARVKDISVSISKHYLVLFGVALLVGAPLGYLSSKALIEFTYEYHRPVTLSGVSIAVIIMLTVLGLTVATQIRKVMKANAVEGLKAE